MCTDKGLTQQQLSHSENKDIQHFGQEMKQTAICDTATTKNEDLNLEQLYI